MQMLEWVLGTVALAFYWGFAIIFSICAFIAGLVAAVVALYVLWQLFRLVRLKINQWKKK